MVGWLHWEVISLLFTRGTKYNNIYNCTPHSSHTGPWLVSPRNWRGLLPVSEAETTLRCSPHPLRSVCWARGLRASVGPGVTQPSPSSGEWARGWVRAGGLCFPEVTPLDFHFCCPNSAQRRPLPPAERGCQRPPPRSKSGNSFSQETLETDCESLARFSK